MRLKTIAAGCGAGVLWTLPYLLPQLSPSHLALYHSRLPASSVAQGNLIDLVLASVCAIFFLHALEKRGPEKLSYGLVWAVIAAKLAAIALSLPFEDQQPYIPPIWIWIGVLATMLGLRRQPHFYRAAIEGVRNVVAFAGLSVFWIVPVLMRQTIYPKVESPMSLLPLHAVPPSAATGKPLRIVWILFDELSYDQTFEHRFPGLAMPSFDRLKSQSTLFTRLAPTGYKTEKVVPSFFLGEAVDAIKSDSRGFPSVRFEGHRNWERFDPQKTVFADAQRSGWTTGIAGWYNPYCRILQGTLNACFWKDFPESDGTSAEESALANAEAPVAEKWSQLAGEPLASYRDHEQTFRVLMPAAEALIRDERISFVYLHLPVPHPPAIYNRKTGMLRAGGSYIDNLALADQALDELMSAIGQTSSAAQTLVIVCSDHSWRTAMWKPAPGWTAEDQAASHGKFDPRPVLMIHFPGQTNEMDIPQPYNELGLHSIIDGILRGELTSAAQFEAWLKPSGEPR